MSLLEEPEEKEQSEQGPKMHHRRQSTVLMGDDGKPKVILTRDTSPRDVYAWFEVTLQEIDVPAQTFTCNVEIHVFWQDFNFPNVFPNFKDEEFSLDEESIPFKISEIFENKVSLEFLDGPTYKFLEETSTLYCSVVLECVFTERMELNRFPLDRQFLNLSFNAWTKEGNWNWILDYQDWVPEEFRKPFSARIVSSITEYELLPPWVDFSSTEPPFSIRLRVNRQPEYYFGNVVFPNFLIVSGCLTALVIHPGKVSDRLGVSVTLMLAAVAFRFVISSMLPKVSYLTFMDYYLLVGFIALMLLIGENAIVGSLPENTRPLTDYAFAIIFTTIWIIVHIIAVLVVVKKDLFRVSWEDMDAIDKNDDTEKFISAAKENIKTYVETDDSKELWNQYKNQTVDERARSYAKLSLHSKKRHSDRRKSREALASPTSHSIISNIDIEENKSYTTKPEFTLAAILARPPDINRQP